MSINKAFVVKNGFEVSTDLILANADTRRVGIAITNPRYTLDVAGGIGATDFYLVGVGTFVNELNVGLGGTVLTVLGIGNSIGIGTALPAYLLDIRSPVSTGQTALYVQGDVRITGDLIVDDITFDDATIQNLTVTEALNVTSPGISTFGGYVDINNSVDISNDLNVSGIATITNVRSTTLNNTGVGTITTLNSTNGTITNINSTGIGTITNVRSTTLNNTGVGTITTLNSTNGTITNLTGTSGTITTFNSTTGNITNLTNTNLNVTGIATIATLNATTVTISGAAVTNFTVSNNFSVGGISTFTNGPILVGTSSSTGTALQRLQVTGGIYVSDNTGIGSTNPTSKLDVIGNVRVTGVITATTFVGALTGTASNVTTNANLTGHVTSVGNAAVLGSFTSSQLATALTDETGTGAAVFATSPTLVTPVLGNATASSINVTGISTLGTVRISSGIITATSGIVTYFGDGSNLTGLAGNPTLQTVLNTGNTSTIGMSISGVTTFTNGPVLIGTATSTGTASQPLQVTGGAYVSGNLGIGTTNPGAKLDVAGDVKLSAADAEIEFNTGGARLKGRTNALSIHTGSGLNSEASEQVRINATGVGIGTTNPTVALQLSPNALISNLNANTNFGTTAGAAATVAQFYHNNGNSSTLRIKATRNTTGSDWTTASTKLVQVIDVTEMGYVEFNPNGANLGMAFGQGASEWARFLSNGNLGIGTTNPTSKLHVVGDVRVIGVVTASAFFGNGSGLTGAGSTVFNDTTTNQEFFPLFTATTSGTITASGISTSKLTYNPSTGAVTAVDFNSTSDVNLKENIHTVGNALEITEQLRGVSFDWKETGKSSYGVIAQELEEVLPELVKQGEVKSVNYNGIIGVLIEAMKELKKEVEDLKRHK